MYNSSLKDVLSPLHKQFEDKLTFFYLNLNKLNPVSIRRSRNTSGKSGIFTESFSPNCEVQYEVPLRDSPRAVNVYYDKGQSR